MTTLDAITSPTPAPGAHPPLTELTLDPTTPWSDTQPWASPLAADEDLDEDEAYFLGDEDEDDDDDDTDYDEDDFDEFDDEDDEDVDTDFEDDDDDL